MLDMLMANSLVSSGMRTFSCVRMNEPCSRSRVNMDDAVAHRQHQGGLRAVDAITGRHLLGARLQEVAVVYARVAFGFF